jgi:AcrR family transcriptional regulator
MNSVSSSCKIANAARPLLDKEGTEAVTLRRVAKAVGITPMAIYRHFKDRASLLNSLADEGFEELTARLAARRLSGDTEKRLTKLGEIHLEYALQHPRLYELMFLKPRGVLVATRRTFGPAARPAAIRRWSSYGKGWRAATSARMTRGRSYSK